MTNQYQHLTKDFLKNFKANDLLPIVCAGCKMQIMKRKGDVLSNIKHSRGTFCTLSCCAKFKQSSKGRKTHVVNCANCGVPTTKSSKDIVKCNKSFCSRKCAATHNNKLRSIEKHIVQCGLCGEITTKTQSSLNRSKSGKVFCSKKCSSKWAASHTERQPKFCAKCSELHFDKTKKCRQCIETEQYSLDNSTLGDLLISNHPGSAKWAKVRGRARTLYKNAIDAGCENCGYNKHAEVCHIKGIPSFPLETLVKVVNERQNILILCKRCHWEFDHDLLDHDAPVRIHLYKKDWSR